MIIATVRIKVPANRRKDFLDSARFISGPTNMDDPDSVLFVEEWSSRKEYEQHIKSDTFRIVLSLMDLSDEPPLIKLNTISKTEGLEAIEAVRSG